MLNSIIQLHFQFNLLVLNAQTFFLDTEIRAKIENIKFRIRAVLDIT